MASVDHVLLSITSRCPAHHAKTTSDFRLHVKKKKNNPKRIPSVTQQSYCVCIFRNHDCITGVFFFYGVFTAPLNVQDWVTKAEICTGKCTVGSTSNVYCQLCIASTVAWLSCPYSCSLPCVKTSLKKKNCSETRHRLEIYVIHFCCSVALQRLDMGFKKKRLLLLLTELVVDVARLTLLTLFSRFHRSWWIWSNVNGHLCIQNYCLQV